MAGTDTRDIIVIGASMGGVEALSSLVGRLPAALPAAVLVVQHRAEDSPGLLPEILSRRGPLPAHTAEDGTRPQRGHIYLAPPDRHMLLVPDGIRVVFGPRENRSRPAIDPLFRTAAVHYGSRVIGVILSGLLADGAAGLRAVQRCGGVALVQAPEQAASGEMPREALQAVPDARSLALPELADLLVELAGGAAPAAPAVPEALRLEAELTERAMDNPDWNVLPGRATEFTCPECNGTIREIEGEGIRRYRCRVGHAYTLDALVAAKDGSVEQALWLALQTLQERAQMLDAIARTERERGRARSAAGMDERAREARQSAERLRELIVRLAA